jgi:hypothetical protein
MHSVSEEIRNKLQDFNNKVQQKDLVKEMLNTKSAESFQDIAEYIAPNSIFNKILEDIAKNGDIQPYEWKGNKAFYSL